MIANMPGPTSQKSPSDVVIVSALRTPLCRARKGAFAKVPPSTLLTTVLQAALEHNGKIEGKDVEDICLGNCLMPPSGFAAMRMAQIVAGIPDSVSMQWVNRQCSSGLQAVAHIANAISTKQIQIGIGGGVESMSFYPM
jgi:acetyl-CoA acyltransferase 1